MASNHSDFDLTLFWAENQQALAKPFRTDKPRAAITLSVDDHWLIEELGVPSTVQFYGDLAYREERHQEANRRCREWLGIAPFPESLSPHSPKRIEELFGCRIEVLEGGTPWIEPGISSPEELSALLDDLEGIDDQALRERLEAESPQPLSGQTEQAWTRGPATVATSVLGTTEAMFAVVDEPDLMERFFRVLAEMIVRRHRILASAQGREVVGVGVLDDNCAFFSPSLYEEFCFPVWETLARELAPNPGDTRFQHSDSEMSHLLPILARLNLSGVNLGPTLTVEQIRKAMPKTVIHGQIAPFTLRDGSREQLEAEVRRDFEGAGADGGLVITTAGSIPAGTSLESIRSWMEMVHQLCRYD